ncbi:MAG: MBOAT family O-acyltransferase [Lachnospiraceae bacterium]|nr:MBOAT family O-acyltransferase [Lachnospiraceae bacterium]
MVFSSITFLFYFLPVITVLYYLAPKSAKNPVLLLGSLFFYAWGEPTYVVLMLLSICGNYFCGRFLEEARDTGTPARELRLYFTGAVAWNLLILFFFKYVNLVIATINSLAGTDFSPWKLSLPIGISFYTFQVLSYVIDVYRGKVQAQRNFISFALYVTMFPQLIAGPIVRYTDIEKELGDRKVTLAMAGKGADRFITGLGKKVLLANSFGAVFTEISGCPDQSRSVLLVWLGAVCFTLQIYFDFSGYSDMAIGLGKMFGFTFPENFQHPLISTSVSEFWRRWHMSLSGWFREYLYIPLGGNRVSPLKNIRNILAVWLFTGLWHGASWNFLCWGLYFAVWLILEKFILGKWLRQHTTAGHIYTILIVVVSFVIFAFTDFGALGIYLKQMFLAGGIPLANARFGYLLSNNWILLVIGGVASTPVLLQVKQKLIRKIPALATFFNLLLLGSSIAYLVFQSYNPFLYFRF